MFSLDHNKDDIIVSVNRPLRQNYHGDQCRECVRKSFRLFKN